jgi:glycine cleavage system H protein
MADIEVRADRRYTKDHEWAKEEGGLIRVGITSFAVDQLGDITLVNIDVKEGDTLTAGRAFGTIESVKTLSDLFAPISGKVSKINKDLENKPELVNEDCYGKGWMIEISPSDSSELASLLDTTAYHDILSTSAH